MLMAGCIAISIWAGINLVLGVGIFFGIAFFGMNAPAFTMLFQPGEVQSLATLDPRAVATVNGVAILANAVIAGYCGLVLAATWLGIAKQVRWTWTTVAATTLFVQLAGFASDRLFENKNLAANILSTVILVAGLSLTALRPAAGPSRPSGGTT